MRNQDSFSPLSDITEYSFGISGINVYGISWNFKWYLQRCDSWSEQLIVTDKTANMKTVQYLSFQMYFSFF